MSSSRLFFAKKWNLYVSVDGKRSLVQHVFINGRRVKICDSYGLLLCLRMSSENCFLIFFLKSLSSTHFLFQTWYFVSSRLQWIIVALSCTQFISEHDSIIVSQSLSALAAQHVDWWFEFINVVVIGQQFSAHFVRHFVRVVAISSDNHHKQ